MLSHTFKEVPNVADLFKNTNTFKEFIKRLNQLACELPVRNTECAMIYGRHTTYNDKKKPIISDKDKNKILGDGFELFTELLITTMGAHPHIGIGEYNPFGQLDGEDDQGIDGFGINMKLERTAIQCKFTNDPEYEFTANGSTLANFIVEAGFENILRKGQLYLFTTAKGINWYTAQKWRNVVIEINRNKISKLVDNNGLFWKNAYELLSV
jgi:hypothetical protein